MVLLKRLAAGYDNDLFVFKIGKNIVKRHYGRYYDDDQAMTLIRREIESSSEH